MKKTILFLMLMLMFMLCQVALAAENLIKNPSFEQMASVVPASWKVQSFDKSAGATSFAIGQDGGHSGNNYIKITNNKANDSRYIQAIRVDSGKKYKMSCWIKTENVSSEGKGANISILGHLETSRDIKGSTEGWEYAEMYLDVVDGATISISVGLGAYSNITTGSAYFDDISVEEVDFIPEEATVAKIEEKVVAENKDAAQNPSKSTDLVMWLSLFALNLTIWGLFIITNSKGKKKEADVEEAEREPEEDETE